MIASVMMAVCATHAVPWMRSRLLLRGQLGE